MIWNYRRQVVMHREVFGSDAGREVLAQILRDAGLVLRTRSSFLRARHYVAIALLERMGVLTGENMARLIDFLLKLPIPESKIGQKGEKHGR